MTTTNDGQHAQAPAGVPEGSGDCPPPDGTRPLAEEGDREIDSGTTPVEKLPVQAKGTLGALATLASALIALMTSLEWVSWTPAQTTLVSAESAAVFTLLTALVAHFWPNTKREPVAIAASLTALASATVALGVGFTWWVLKPEQVAAVESVIAAAVGLGAALIARQLVVADHRPLRRR